MLENLKHTAIKPLTNVTSFSLKYETEEAFRLPLLNTSFCVVRAHCELQIKIMRIFNYHF